MIDTPRTTPSRSDDRVGERIGDRYRLLERIGQGGMATVYRARDEQLERDVALKVFRRELASAEDLRRQQAEVRILARLTHPSLVTLYDAVSDADGRAALVLEYVPGSDVRRRLADGAMPPPTVGAIGRDVARALAHIHSRGVVHRDVAPGNILLPRSEPSGRAVDAKLTDLGIARLVDEGRVTSTGGVVGTPQYLSPEQAQGERLTPASDIYSLGLVLLECLTGERAFPGSAVESAVARIAHDPAIPERVGPGWRELLAAMTRRDPEHRPTAAAVADELSELLAPLTPSAGDAVAGSSGEASQSGERTLAMTAPAMPTASTKRLPTSLLPAPRRATTPARTERLHATAVPHAPRPADVRRAPVLGGAAILVLVVALIVVLLIVWPRGDGAVPVPAASYPAVPGQLGTDLGQLEQDVSPQHAP